MNALSQALLEGGAVAPKFKVMLIPPKRLSLTALLKEGLTVPAENGKEKVKVKFEQVGKAFPAQENTGWYAVKIRSNFGGFSTMLFVPTASENGDGEISGILRLRK